jgi:membrane protein YqaA with SNARE-associated domain
MSGEPVSETEDALAEGATDETSDTLSLDARSLGIKVILGGLLFAVLVIGLGAAFWDTMHAISRDFVTHFGGPGVFLGFFLADAFTVPLPVDAFNAFALFGGMSFVEVVVWASCGSLIGGSLGYFVGGWLRHFHWFKRFYGKRADKMDRLVARYGVHALAVTALTPLPFSLGCWACGALKMRFSLFLLVSLLRIPRVAAYLALIYFGLLSVTP